MGVGKRISGLRKESGLSQRELSEISGLAVSYLSRIENGHINPSVRTLQKLADALQVPLSLLFTSSSRVESPDRCPVSQGGRCILDLAFVGKAQRPNKRVESYTSEQLKLLRQFNYLLHVEDSQILAALSTTVQSLILLAEAEKRKARRGGP